MDKFEICVRKNQLHVKVSGKEQTKAFIAITFLILLPFFMVYAFPLETDDIIFVSTACVIAIVGTCYHFKNVFVKEYFLFDKNSQTISYLSTLDKHSQFMQARENRSVHFDEIDFINLIRIEGEEGVDGKEEDRFVIALQLKNRESIQVCCDGSPDATTKEAQKIAAFINKGVLKSG